MLWYGFGKCRFKTFESLRVQMEFFDRFRAQRALERWAEDELLAQIIEEA